MKYHQATLSKFSEKSFFLKMATKILLPVSIFAIIVSYSSLISFALQFFNFCFSAYSKQLSDYSIDKNYMFLLCNGILVLIVKNSGVINKSPEETDLNNPKIGIKERESEKQVVKLSEEKVHMEIEEAQERESEKQVVKLSEEKVHMEIEEAQETAANVVSVAQDDQANEPSIKDEDEEEAAEEEGTGLLSTEELNKRCDDFIRKMKEVIKFEAQTAQLIMV